MPLITQGKTNWKFVVIVIILALIVGAVVLWCVTRLERPYQSLEIKKSEKVSFEQLSTCNTDSDCILVSHKSCGGTIKISINKKHESLYNSTLEFQDSTGEICKTLGISYDEQKQIVGGQVPTESLCVNNKCIPKYLEDETVNWETYKSEKYGFEIRYPEDWIISKNILGAFEIYKNFEKYQCSIEIYANKDKYLYPLGESNKYFQGFSESQISIKPEEAFIGNISAIKISSPDLSGREIFFFKKKIEDREYYFNIFLDVTDLRYKYDVIVKNHDCKEIFNRTIATFNFPENIFAKDLFDEPICKYRKAQFEMRIYDIQGRITGVLDGKIKEEIPGSYCTQDKESNETIIDLPPDTVISKLEIFGITDGNYEFSINGPNPEEPYGYIGVKAKDIPIVSRVLHHFEFDWKNLSKGKEGVAIMIDTNNDHVFEKTIVSDSDLSCEEFIIQLKER